MKTFHFERDEDVSGVSGTGRVAEGVVFSNGQVALTWTTEPLHRSVIIYQSFADMVDIHGHQGKTKIVWDK